MCPEQWWAVHFLRLIPSAVVRIKQILMSVEMPRVTCQSKARRQKHATTNSCMPWNFSLKRKEKKEKKEETSPVRSGGVSSFYFSVLRFSVGVHNFIITENRGKWKIVVAVLFHLKENWKEKSCTDWEVLFTKNPPWTSVF
jgi:hypothetical protein